jgi:hypothetical protein
MMVPATVGGRGHKLFLLAAKLRHFAPEIAPAVDLDVFQSGHNARDLLPIGVAITRRQPVEGTAATDGVRQAAASTVSTAIRCKVIAAAEVRLASVRIRIGPSRDRSNTARKGSH